jgi:hypothetical protein
MLLQGRKKARETKLHPNYDRSAVALSITGKKSRKYRDATE